MRGPVSLLVALIALALGADLLASELPLAARVDGATYLVPCLTRPSALAGQTTASLRRRAEWVVGTPVAYGPNQTLASTQEDRPTPPPWAPDAAHWLGTDELGRDVLARLLHGARVSLAIALLTVLLALVVGATLGGLAGLRGGWLDAVVSRLIELLTTFPLVFFLLVVLSLVRTQSLVPLVLALGLTRWTELARVVRAEVLWLKTQPFVLASRAMGASSAYILRKHLIPNAIGPIAVNATYGVAGAMLLESTLSFLGLGVAPPTASWGELLTQAQRTAVTPGAWWLALFPGLALVVTVGAVNALGQAVERRFDLRR